MKKNLIKVCFGIIFIIILTIVIFFMFFVRNEVNNINAVTLEHENSVDVTLEYTNSFKKCYSYSISNKSNIFSIKVKSSPFFGEDWPVEITIDEKPENIKAIEITDGNNSKVIYP